ncbi:elongator complex protein 3 [Trichloromonas sp.]|uniref:elongator complex protein 3 n=1 Tax=Trichloromonas sp. TaxID=3069249 RepID=UPI003D81819A
MRIYPFFIDHAGCPHRCSYCRQEASVGHPATLTAADVARQLPEMLEHGRGGEVAFYGGTFTLLPTADQRAYLEAVSPYLGSGEVGGIRISTRPDALAVEQIELLKGCGVSTVEVGCQSFSREVLTRSFRGHGPEAALQSVFRLQQHGIRVGIQLMPGLPGGSRKEALASLSQALSLKPDFLRIYPVVVLRDTLLARQYAAGQFSPLALDEAVDLCAEMVWHCQRFSVPVIRVGLQATDGLNQGDAVLAGPYHPAFGQLVRSRLWLRALQNLASTGHRSVLVHRADLADALGNKRHNIVYLQQKYPYFTVRAVPESARQTLTSDLDTGTLHELSAYPIEEFIF